MKPSEQLQWEADNGPRFAVAGFLSAVLTLASFGAQATTFSGARSDREVLRAIDDHNVGILLGRVTQAAAVIFLVIALYYLLQATRARRPEGLQYLWPIGVLAPLLLMIAGVTGYLDATAAANDFVSGAQTAARAEAISDDINGAVTKAVGQAGGLCLGLTYVLICVNSMRAGLLSRFMGILGIIGGVLVVIPLLPGGIIQLFWIVALGVLFLDRWPNGRGPAWSAVEAIPWPTAAEIRGLSPSKGGSETDPPPLDEPGEDDAREEPAQRRSSRKKKRKR